MLRLVRGSEPVTAFQHAFYRAGHAHAGGTRGWRHFARRGFAGRRRLTPAPTR
jgi:hypothetical protein